MTRITHAGRKGSQAKDSLEKLKETLPEIRQLRFREVTFSFHIVDLESLGIGNELVDLIRAFKKELEPNLKTFHLPKLVRIVVWSRNPMSTNSTGTFGGVMPLLSTSYHFSINTDNLHEEEIGVFERTIQFRLRLIHVFLHELAHFITTDEKKADDIAFEIIKKTLKGKSST